MFIVVEDIEGDWKFGEAIRVFFLHKLLLYDDTKLTFSALLFKISHILKRP